MKEYGFALIGCGAIARLHVQAIQHIDNAKLVGVFDFKQEFAEKFAKENNCVAFTTLEELLAHKEISIVNICTPSGLHAEQIVRVANAKKHIIVEKPMAITDEQLSQAIAAIHKNNVKIEVVSQLRFVPSIKIIKETIEKGLLGKIYIADFKMKYYRSPEYYKASGWRGTWAMDGGGALMNQGIHGIDLVQYLMGGVKSVYAECGTLARDIEVEDTANLLVEYKNGAMGVIQGTTVAKPGYAREIEIHGEKGTIVAKEDIIEVWDVEGTEKPDCCESCFNSGANPMDFSCKYHSLQFSDLIAAIENDAVPIVDEHEGRKPVDIILAAYESSKTGKKIVLN